MWADVVQCARPAGGLPQRLRVVAHQLSGLDAAALRIQAAEKPFFPLSAASNGTFTFNRSNLQADFSNGSAEIHDAKLVGEAQTLTLSGVVTYQSNGLALSGSLEATDPAKAADGTIRKLHAKSVGENSAHGSDAPETAAIEIAQFFSGNEIVG